LADEYGSFYTENGLSSSTTKADGSSVEFDAIKNNASGD